MSELLKTKRIGYEIEDLISSAKKYICIFTYSLKIDNIYLERLKAANHRGVDIVLVFGVEPKNWNELPELLSLTRCRVYYKEFMHAKFYYNEETLIISSMNLSEVSEKKNYELGILFKKEKYPEIFEKIKTEAKDIVTNAFEIRPGMVLVGNSQNTATKKAAAKTGYCIRCGHKIPYNPGKPFCFGCYDEWAEWENEEYEENYCHCCKSNNEYVSFLKPECFSCYSKN